MAKTASKSEYITIVGHVAWAKVYDPDVGFGQTKWSIDIYPDDDEQWAKFKAAGIQKTIRENTDPSKGLIGKYFKTDRLEHKLVGNNVVYWVGPVIMDMDGNVIVDYINKKTGKRAYSYNATEKNDIERRGFPILIGNGSKVEARINVFDTIKGKGQRLESLKILELVEYERELPKLSPLVEGRERASEKVTAVADTEQPW